MSRLPLTRRGFLQSAAGLTLAAGSGLGLHWATRDRVRLAIIGGGGRGQQLAQTVRRNCWRRLYGEVRAVCDVHTERARQLQQLCGAADVYAQHEAVLARDDIDAVIIATPDHWHAPMALAAMQAGKAVYCEKPVSLTVAEGQELVRVAEQTGCVFQVGTQQRSGWMFQAASELVRNGRLGHIERVNIFLPDGSLPPEAFGGPFESEAAPAALDWDRWLGPAPTAEFCKQRYNPFRWWFEYSGGFMTDWGTHHLDIAQLALGVERSGPIAIDGRTELPQIANGYNTPRQFDVRLRYASGAEATIRLDRKKSGVEFIGERGSLFVNRRAISGSAWDESLRHPLPDEAERCGNRWSFLGTMNDIHVLDFLAHVKTGEQPISDIASAHRSASACHLANISMRLGRPLRWDPLAERCVDDAVANSMLQRESRTSFTT